MVIMRGDHSRETITGLHESRSIFGSDSTQPINAYYRSSSYHNQLKTWYHQSGQW